MIILGNRYKLTEQEQKQVLQQVNSIIHIDDKMSDDAIIEEIKKHIENIEFIVLNLSGDLPLKVESFLEELDYEDVKIILFSEFSKKFLQKDIDTNGENLKVLQAVHGNVKGELLKRVFDIVFSIAALICLSPVFLIIAILIKVKSPDGSIFFGHQRIGQNGKFFRVYKFRTMVPDAEERLKKMLDENPKIKEEFEKDFKLKDDPRIIPGIGNFLRKSSLDELPQFFNVLIGNMSVVGPRPIVEDEVKKYGKYADIVFSIKPGVTGLWQVSGRNDIDYDERVQMDMEYIEKQNFWLDLEIIYKTVLVMVFRKGAY